MGEGNRYLILGPGVEEAGGAGLDVPPPQQVPAGMYGPEPGRRRAGRRPQDRARVKCVTGRSRRSPSTVMSTASL
ncbi:hypothetical protein GCM10010260_37220 [Streptomyces filipinensis]|uniref:Uncharacterized protein n=1 Tax=Streptomyces filipinensis TaxID=66887 RepID=A0A918IBB7_9ACTN|nr:hypothetical protein GCM10010260_37220 [Streptomyces filipinensis]